MTANWDVVSFGGDENVLTQIVVVVRSVNLLNAIKLYMSQNEFYDMEIIPQ